MFDLSLLRVIMVDVPKHHLVMLLFLVAATSMFEAMGLGLVFPAIKLLGNPDLVFEDEYLSWAYQTFGFESPRRFTQAVFVCLGAAFILKNAAGVLTIFAQAWFVSRNAFKLSKRFNHLYLNAPHAFHLKRDSAEAINNTIYVTRQVFVQVINSALSLTTETFLIVAIVTVLFLNAPVVTLCSIAILLVLFGGFYSVFRRYLALIGERMAIAQRDLLATARDGLSLVRELQVLQRCDYFDTRFQAVSERVADLQIRTAVLNTTPRNYSEAALILLVTPYMVWMLNQEQSVTAEVLPLISMFAVAAVRLMPSANRILVSMNQVRFNARLVSKLATEFEALMEASAAVRAAKADDGEPFVLGRDIRIENVSYTYPDAEGPTIKSVDLTVPKGTSMALVGPSGAGKSTLADLLLGLLTPTSGRILVDGHDIQDHLKRWQAQLGLVPQAPLLVNDTVRRNIAIGIEDSEIDEAHVMRAVRSAQLADVVAELPDGLDTPIGDNGVRLSGGQRQRLTIARALYHDPSVLIMDEATSALDTSTEHEVTKAINRLQGEKTLIVIAHRLSTVMKCDRLCLIEDGRVVAVGPYEELARTVPNFQKMIEHTRLTA